MKARLLARFCALLLPVMGLVASTAPPAHATTALVLVFLGAALVANGLAYPCILGKTVPAGSFDALKCPVVGSGNTVGVTLFGGLGVGATLKLNKAKCKNLPINACIQLALYAIAALGATLGWCGLSLGLVVGVITKAGDIVPPSPITKPMSNNVPVLFAVGWPIAVGGLLPLLGLAVRGTQTGPVVGLANATVVPLLGLGTCLNKDVKTFLVVGAVATVLL